MKSRPGYTLNEILALLALFLVILSFSAKMGWTLIREIPMTDRYFNTQAGLESMLDSLRQDIETARDLELSEEAGKEDEEETARTLIVNGPEGRIVYAFDAEQMQRILPDPNAPGASAWTLPDVRIEWQVRRPNVRAKALEIRAWQQRTFLGKERINFEQAHLFFVGIQNPEGCHEE